MNSHVMFACLILSVIALGIQSSIITNLQKFKTEYNPLIIECEKSLPRDKSCVLKVKAIIKPE